MPQRLFGNVRPPENRLTAIRPQRAHGHESFRELPPPTGMPPFRMDLADVIGDAEAKAIEKAGCIAIHMVGDTGGVKYPIPQQIVANHMESQLHDPDRKKRPAFFYHLGDVVYFNGEAVQYYPQFYQPYENYRVPIFAIPGNHDGMNLPGDSSLAGFVQNFCAPTPDLSPDAGDVDRAAMTQPNCYFTLRAPLVTIIGLYTNVPEGGKVRQEQREWFVGELKAAPRNRALLVCLHHPPLSMDNHHSGSTEMLDLLDGAFADAKRVPHAVFAAHVHDFQRFTRVIGKRQVPFVVAGAGGYHNLHGMQKLDDGRDLPVPFGVGHDATLESYVDDYHGFLRLMIDAEELVGEYYAVPRPHESWSKPAERWDAFHLNLAAGKLVTPHA